jgi:hypothetical protein
MGKRCWESRRVNLLAKLTRERELVRSGWYIYTKHNDTYEQELEPLGSLSVKMKLDDVVVRGRGVGAHFRPTRRSLYEGFN